MFRQKRSPAKTTFASGISTTESPPVCPGRLRMRICSRAKVQIHLMVVGNGRRQDGLDKGFLLAA